MKNENTGVTERLYKRSTLKRMYDVVTDNLVETMVNCGDKTGRTDGAVDECHHKASECPYKMWLKVENKLHYIDMITRKPCGESIINWHVRELEDYLKSEDWDREMVGYNKGYWGKRGVTNENDKSDMG